MPTGSYTTLRANRPQRLNGSDRMYQLNLESKSIAKLDETTFKDLSMHECDLEEIIRHNVDLICGDEESMLIVGQQVKNDRNARSDLTAIDNNGDIVLIELKRDKKDILSRKEPFEFQAIRYAAAYATLKSVDELIQNVFAPYVEKHKGEFSTDAALTSSELAARLLEDFIERNEITALNEHQRIILVASEFDEQTLSAVAWLNRGGIDIGCYQVCLYLKEKDRAFLDMKKLLPISQYEDFYIGISGNNIVLKDRPKRSRQTLPNITAMMSWGIVNKGDLIGVKDKEDTAILQKDGYVKTDRTGETISLQQWLKRVMGWASVDTYNFAVDMKTGKTLSRLREEYMRNMQSAESEG